MKYNSIFSVTFLLLCVLFVGCFQKSDSKKPPEPPFKVIVDTDMESDVDDVGALAMLHALADMGEAELLGVMVCAVNPWSTLCADRINTYFKRENLPLGQLKRPGVDRESRYAKQVAEEFQGKFSSPDDVPDAVDQYRMILSSQPDNSVIILTIGYLTNLRDLIKSGPDEHSELEGQELIKQKVHLWVCMGGWFPEGRESNILWDTEASVFTINNWPTEIVFSGWEIGLMDTGGQILDLPMSSPVRRSYELFGRIPHKNWDQVAGLFAVRGLYEGPAAHYWQLSEPGRIVIDATDGSNTWEADSEGTHRHLIQLGSNEEIAKEIDELMMHLPAQ